jgi:carboxyl-terminal processing protease
MNRNRILILGIPLILIIGLFSFKQTDPGDRTFLILKNLDIFATLFKEINQYYVDEINPTEVMKTGIDAMLNSLDPYTDYIPEDDIEDYMTMTTGEYGGIGAVVERKNGINTVILAYENSPAEKAGLKIGDQILAINGKQLEGMDSDEIGRLLKGQSNSGIDLTVQRYGTADPFTVTLKREKITINNVPYYGMASSDVGYIRLTDFTTKAGKEVASALKELKKEGATKMILDLRGNPGGLLDEAINVSNVFVPKGVEIVSTRGKLESWTKVYRSPAEPVDTEIPLVVLTNNMSASASEIVAGVMQDYDRGVLVGRKTFGKGLVQQTRPLAYNSQLKVTTAKYYIPSGRCIQAIDYANRNDDGSVGKIADSLKAEFKTLNGRLVYDGGGVDPDSTVQKRKYAPITMSLLQKDLIFDYATRYYYDKPEIASAMDFELSENDYQEFVSWLSDKDYDYTTDVEKTIDQLVEKAQEEKYYEEIKDQIYSLKKATLHNKEQDLQTFKQEIKILLEQEIASRYFFQRGMIESTFDVDNDIQAAISILGDTSLYNSILANQ